MKPTSVMLYTASGLELGYKVREAYLGDRARGLPARLALQQAKALSRPPRLPKEIREALDYLTDRLERGHNVARHALRRYRDGTRLEVTVKVAPDDLSPWEAGLGRWHSDPETGRTYVAIGKGKSRRVPTRIKVQAQDRQPECYWEPEGYSIPERVKDYWERGRTFSDALALALREVREEEARARDYQPVVGILRVLITDGVREEELAQEGVGGLADAEAVREFLREALPYQLDQARPLIREGRAILHRRADLARRREEG